MNHPERRRRAMAFVSLLVGVVLLSRAAKLPEGLYVAGLVLAVLALRWAVELLAEGPRADLPPAPEDFGQPDELRHLRDVYDAAYRWRYAVMTSDVTEPGSAANVAERELIDAVDEWDMNRPHHPQGGPL